MSKKLMLLAFFACSVIVIGMLVRLHIDVRTLMRRTQRLDEDTLEIRKSGYAAAKAFDDLNREWQCFRRPAGLTRERGFTRVLRRPSASFVLALEPSERPVRGSIEIRNEGTASLRDVRVQVNGRRYFKTTREMIQFAAPDAADDREKAFALYRFVRNRRYHWFPAESSRNAGAELHCPVKFFNVYGYGHCDDAAINLAMLWQAAGLNSRVWGLNGHVVAEVHYEGAWHVFDPDGEAFYLARDNRSVAACEKIREEPYLVVRTPFGLPAYNRDRARIARYYADDDNRLEPVPKDRGHNLTLNLLPGERFIQKWFTWDRDLMFHAGYVQPAIGVPWWHEDSAPRFHAADSANAPPYMGTAEFIWQLPSTGSGAGEVLSGAASPDPVVGGVKKGDFAGVSLQNLALAPAGDQRLLQNKDRAAPGSMLFYKRVPFVLVGGDFRADFIPGSPEDWVEVQILRRADAKGKPDVATSRRFSGAAGKRMIYVNFDRAFSGDYSFATYEYGFKVVLHCTGEGGLAGLRIAAQTQATPFCPFALKPGGNPVEFSAANPGQVDCALRFVWFDDTGLQRIEGSPEPVGEEVLEDGRLRLSWKPPRVSDHLPPAWYQVYVSPRKDFLWPVAPGFDAHVSGDRTTWTSPADFLQPKATYHWRIRAKDGHGFSSDFSATRSFMVGPLGNKNDWPVEPPKEARE